MQYLKDDLKDRILISALKEFFINGYKDCTMRNIAKASGMTVGNLYHYFKNKKEIFKTLIEPLTKEIDDIIYSHDKNHLYINNKFDEFSRFLAGSIMSLYKKYPKELEILMNLSKGSEYENYKDILIQKIADHIKENCNLIVESIVYKVLAKNHLDGFIDILNTISPNEQKEKALLQYVKIMSSIII